MLVESAPAVTTSVDLEKMRMRRAFREARALLDDPERWTRGNDAINDEGFAVEAENSRAVQWCLLGAVIRSGQPWLGDEAGLRRVGLVLAQAIGEERLPFGRLTTMTHRVSLWNDERATHADVLDALDRAVELV